MITVLLDNIRSQHNVGSIFRTADAAGCEKIFLCGITPDPIDRFGRPNTKLTKVSLGAENTVTWEHKVRTGTLLKKLKKDGYHIVALECRTGRSIPLKQFKPHKKEKYVLVLGSETEGISPALLQYADTVVEIPMCGQKESLNVAVAFGIMVYHFVLAHPATPTKLPNADRLPASF